MNTVQYLLKDKILHMVLRGEVTFDQIDDIGCRTVSLIESSTLPPVHIVINETNINDISRHLPSLIKSTQWLSHPQIGVVIPYGAQSQLVRFVTATAAQFAGAQFRFANTFDEAVAFLQILDETLPDLSTLTPTTVQGT